MTKMFLSLYSEHVKVGDTYLAIQKFLKFFKNSKENVKTGEYIN